MKHSFFAGALAAACLMLGPLASAHAQSVTPILPGPNGQQVYPGATYLVNPAETPCVLDLGGCAPLWR